MAKKFLSEKQWLISKGNEYMRALLQKSKPSVSCQCPKSYIIFQNMFKNSVDNKEKEYERLFQNSILQKKLDLVNLRKASPIYLPQKNFYSQRLNQHKSFYREVIENKDREWVNDNWYRRIMDSKSFLSKMKGIKSVSLIKRNHKSNTESRVLKSRSTTELFKRPSVFNSSKAQVGNNHQVNNVKDLFRKKLSKSTSDSTWNHSSPVLNKTHRDPTVWQYKWNLLFDCNKLNDELMKRNVKTVELYNMKRYVRNLGLVNARFIYCFNRWIIMIKPYTMQSENVFLIHVNERDNLDLFTQKYKTYEMVLNAIEFENNTMTIKKAVIAYEVNWRKNVEISELWKEEIF